jgi:hypothetical protein
MRRGSWRRHLDIEDAALVPGDYSVGRLLHTFDAPVKVANGPRLAGGADVLGGRADPVLNSRHSEPPQRLVGSLNLRPSFGNEPVKLVGSFLAALQPHWEVPLGHRPKLIPLRFLRL